MKTKRKDEVIWIKHNFIKHKIEEGKKLIPKN